MTAPGTGVHTAPIGPATPSALRERYRREQRRLEDAFAAGTGVARLLRARARLADGLLRDLWRSSGMPSRRATLLAVGGYGRAELHPASDVDVCVLLAGEPDDATRAAIERFVTGAWDIGLRLGHSVRTPEQCREAAAADITVMTNLMESRRVAGARRLAGELDAVLADPGLWPADAFFRAKVAEQQARHRRHQDALKDLEPHVKEGPGGLRDLQTILWTAQRHLGARGLTTLGERGFLRPRELRRLRAGRDFLWRVRYALHVLSGRCEDRLLFDYQPRIAALFGYRDDDGPNRAVERFMRRYYRAVTELSRLNEILLGVLEEAITPEAAAATPLNRRFRVRGHRLEVSHEAVFARYPFALLEAFLLLQSHPEIEGIRPSTIRAIADNLHRIDAAFRQDLRCRTLFMEILRQPRRIGDELQRMHRYGVLAAYLPAFRAVTGLMQFDLFHHYTVDEHSLLALRMARQFSYPRAGDPPLATRTMARIPKPELLYLAALFHDVGKGRGGDHSARGAAIAARFCSQHDLPAWDTALVEWLVRNHLLMSQTAQRRDISDVSVINEFAREVRDHTHLDYLYLLTVADIRATNPGLWNSWRDALLGELYHQTAAALRRGLERPLERAERVAATRAQALGELLARGHSRRDIERLWRTLGERYFLRHGAAEVVWHTDAILRAGSDALPLVLAEPHSPRGGTSLFVYAPDRERLFAALTHALEEAGVSVHEARIETSADGRSLDTFVVLDAATGAPVRNPRRLRTLVEALRQAAARPADELRVPSRPPSRQQRQFRIEPDVTIEQDPHGERTIVEVIAADRPGVLSRIAHAFADAGASVHTAQVATLGERVEDVFYVTDRRGRRIDGGQRLGALRERLLAALAER